MKKILAVLSVAALLLFAVWAVLPGASPVMAASGTDLETGSATGTGAAITVQLGFTPRYVVVTNLSTTSPVKAEWDTGMTAYSCLKSVSSATGGAGNANVAIVSLASTSCISPYTGSTTTKAGFIIGTDAALNETGKTLRYRAWR